MTPVATDGAVSLMGYDFDLTDPDIWGYSPDRKRHWPRKYRRRYDLAGDSTGDYKLAWELGRLQFLPGLLARDPAAGRRVLDSYLAYDRPLGTIQWFSEMELGIRMISLMWCTMLIEPDDPLRRRLVEHVGLLYHFLRDHLTTWWTVRNNHILIEVAALLAYEMLLPGEHDRHAEHWRILLRESHDQIYHDGGIREQSTSYARFNLDAFLLLWLLAELTETDPPGWLRRLVENMLEFLRDLRPPDGRWPQVGDGDDGRVIPPTSGRDMWDFGGHLAIGAVLCNRPSFKVAAGGWDNDFACLLPPDYAERFDALGQGHLTPGGQLYRQSGWWTWRSASGGDADYALIRAGDFGLGGAGAAPHSHCDELSLILHWAGHPILVDGGTYTYDPVVDDWRQRFRGCETHNVLQVNDWLQAERLPHGNFSWGQVPAARFEEANEDHATACFDDYRQRYRWRRAVALAPSHVRLVDRVDLAEPGEHTLHWYFNFAPGVEAELNDGGLIGRVDGLRFRLTAEGLPASATWRIAEGHYSERYNRKTSIPRLVVTTAARVACEVQWTMACES